MCPDELETETLFPADHPAWQTLNWPLFGLWRAWSLVLGFPPCENVKVLAHRLGFAMPGQTINCPTCASPLKVKEPVQAGTAVQCPTCGGNVPVIADNTALLNETSARIELENPEALTNQIVFSSADLIDFPFLGPPEQPDEIGRLGPYRVLAPIGAGGMGAVFRAEDPQLQREVALKVLLPECMSDDEAKTRFLREARAQAKVEHEHVAAIFQVGEDRGVPYLAMPLLKGMTLHAALAANPRPPTAEVIRIGREIAEGLSAAHEQGLIHRDIKPANIWLEGKRLRVRILDFGLARPTDSTPGAKPLTQLTGKGLVLGTPAYMSPEQARGLKLDGRSDLFSLGTVLYQMTTGQVPFDGDTTMAILTALAVDDPPPPIARNPAVPPALSDSIMRLLAKKPENRPPTGEVFAAEMRAIETGLGATVQVIPLDAPPIVVSPSGVDPFAELDTTEANPAISVPATPVRTRASEPRAPERTGFTIAAIAAGVLLAVAGAVWFVFYQLTPKSVELVEEKKPDPPKPNPSPKKNPPQPDPEPDRKAAEYVLSSGGRVRVTGIPKEVESLNDLPRGPLLLLEVHLLGNRQVDDAGLAVFKDCKHIRILTLQLTRVTDVGLAHFKNCKDLIMLDVCGTQVTDAGLAHLKDCKELEILYLATTRVTDAGLAYFKDCKNLRAANLFRIPITEGCVDQLKGYKNLDYLNVNQSPIGPAKIDELRAALPRCRIEATNGIFEPKQK